MNNNNKNLILVGIVTILLIGGGAFWFLSQKETEEPLEPIEEKGVVGTAKDISESVPEIQTNVGEEVPEINPLDRANPYKYTNPLR